jgi:hypothetical protein
MSKQVLSIEQMKHLQELGVDTSKASMYWIRIIRPATARNRKETVVLNWFLSFDKEAMHTGFDVVEKLPAFTFQDIFDLLPKKIKRKDNGSTSYLEVIFPNDDAWEVTYSYCESFFNESLIDAAYEMLCWCIENGYVKTNKKE